MCIYFSKENYYISTSQKTLTIRTVMRSRSKIKICNSASKTKNFQPETPFALCIHCRRFVEGEPEVQNSTCSFGFILYFPPVARLRHDLLRSEDICGYTAPSGRSIGRPAERGCGRSQQFHHQQLCQMSTYHVT